MVRCFMRLEDPDDEAQIAAARDVLADTTGITEAPIRTVVRHRSDALPVMHVGHRARVAEIRSRTERLGGLALGFGIVYLFGRNRRGELPRVTRVLSDPNFVPERLRQAPAIHPSKTSRLDFP